MLSTIANHLRSLAAAVRWRQVRVAAVWAASIALSAAAQPAAAQLPAVHYRFSGDLSPGAIGSAQLQRGGPLPGYFQPVEIKAPSGAEISLAAQGQFDDSQPAPLLVAMLIGPVYCLRVTRIPYHPGEELFPTIELIDRLYPPAGQQRRFPIVVELALEDLELALRGNYVTRVIYLEDPDQALPAAETGEQIRYDAGAGEDPLQMADVLGRPVAILRLGGRLPLADGDNEPQQATCTAPFIKLQRPSYLGLPRRSPRDAEPSSQPAASAGLLRTTPSTGAREMLPTRSL
jgi:hypothetical protein